MFYLRFLPVQNDTQPGWCGCKMRWAALSQGIGVKGEDGDGEVLDDGWLGTTGSDGMGGMHSV